jgi:cytochrome c oxidase accessory protein FixG
MSQSAEAKPQHPDSVPQDAIASNEASGGRHWLYPTPNDGPLWKGRLIVGWILIAVFTALPIVEFGGKPAVFLDLATRQFTFFGATFHATDTIFLMLLLLSVLLAIGLITAVFGRVWCGWGCPQTVYLEFVFRPIERLVEGSSTQRKHLDEGPWTAEKVTKKVIKHLLYAVVALALAHTFVAYFVSWDRLLAWMGKPPTEHWGYFVMMAFTTGLILFDFAYFREQMCVKICPYAKFQSVLLDRDSLIVSYDEERGEPRGRRSRDQRRKEQEGVELDLGDCIDCGACVRTCPTGIDIRDGLQLECVNCTQCIDACNDIMEKVGKPKGLIRFTSQNALEDEETNIVRTRVVVYALLLAVAVGSFGFLLANRSATNIDVRRAPGSAFKRLEQADGAIANQLRFRIRNGTQNAKTYTVEPLSPKSASLKPIGPAETRIGPGEMKRLGAWVLVPPGEFDGAQAEAQFAIRADREKIGERSIELLGPAVDPTTPESSADGRD